MKGKKKMMDLMTLLIHQSKALLFPSNNSLHCLKRSLLNIMGLRIIKVSLKVLREQVGLRFPSQKSKIINLLLRKKRTRAELHGRSSLIFLSKTKWKKTHSQRSSSNTRTLD
jgi:hypothetical protein